MSYIVLNRNRETGKKNGKWEKIQALTIENIVYFLVFRKSTKKGIKVISIIFSTN